MKASVALVYVLIAVSSCSGAVTRHADVCGSVASVYPIFVGLLWPASLSFNALAGDDALIECAFSGPTKGEGG